MINDPLINELFEMIEEDAAKEKPRGYLGASSIGDECELKLWLKLNFPEKAAPRKAKLILAAMDGHRGEDIAASYLCRLPGIELKTKKEDGTQHGFCDGKFRGHIDGLIYGIPYRAPTNEKVWHIWENKNCNQKKFDELLKIQAKFDAKNVLEEWNYQYYAQAVIYMHYFRVSRHYTTVWLSGNRDLATIITEANQQFAELLISKAKRVINAKSPPVGISDNPAFFKCKKDWCEFAENCPSLNLELRGAYELAT